MLAEWQCGKSVLWSCRKCGNANRRVPLLKIVNYCREKEKLVSRSVCHNHSESGIYVVQPFATLISRCLFLLLYKNQDGAIGPGDCISKELRHQMLLTMSMLS